MSEEELESEEEDEEVFDAAEQLAMHLAAANAVQERSRREQLQAGDVPLNKRVMGDLYMYREGQGAFDEEAVAETLEQASKNSFQITCLVDKNISNVTAYVVSADVQDIERVMALGVSQRKGWYATGA